MKRCIITTYKQRLCRWCLGRHWWQCLLLHSGRHHPWMSLRQRSCRIGNNWTIHPLVDCRHCTMQSHCLKRIWMLDFGCLRFLDRSKDEYESQHRFLQMMNPFWLFIVYCLLFVDVIIIFYCCILSTQISLSLFLFCSIFFCSNCFLHCCLQINRGNNITLFSKDNND